MKITLCFTLIAFSLSASAHLLGHHHKENNKEDTAIERAKMARQKYVQDQELTLKKGYTKALYQHINPKVKRSQQTTDFPGINTTAILDYATVKEKMQQLAGNLANGKWVRGNTLGTSIVNTAQWQESPLANKGMALSLPPEAHAHYRPHLEQLFAPETSPFYQNRLVEASIEAMIGELKGTLKFPDAIYFWNTALMWQLHAGVKLSPSEIIEFLAFQEQAFKLATLHVDFDGMLEPPVSQEKIQEVIKQRAKWRGMLAENLKTRIKGVDASKLGDILLDSLIFAAGPSIPNTIGAGLGVLYGGKLSVDGRYGSPLGHMLQVNLETNNCPPLALTLTDDNINHFVWELFRYYPPVGAISWYENVKTTNSYDPYAQDRSILIIRSALSDPKIWQDKDGKPNPDEFSMSRPIKHYEQYAKIGWAHPAKGGRKGQGYNHSCPAEELSFMIVKSFFKTWMAQQNKWCMTKPGYDKAGTSKLLTDNDFGPFPGFTLQKVNN